MTPSVGRIVHFYVVESERANNGGREFCPAVITHVHAPNTVNLKLLYDGEYTGYASSVPQGEKTPYTWCWPPQVK